MLRWIAANLPREVYISLIAQYFPTHLASGMPPLNRRVTAAEYRQVVEGLGKLGLKKGFIQELEASPEEYVPLFDLRGV